MISSQISGEKQFNYNKFIVVLIAISTVIRLVFITATELGADEVYYWSFALRPQWNYFDHPPIVAWLIRLSTANLFFHNEFAVRLGSVICSAICTWIFFKIGSTLDNAKTGWYASLLYTSSIYCSVFIGGHILPDTPQMVFWLLNILIMLKISRQTDEQPQSMRLWCMFGITAGLCIMCKVHGVFLWLGAALYILTAKPQWLRSPGIYLSALLTLVIISPILIWNLQNDFVTYSFHSNRVNIGDSGINFMHFGKAVLQQISICNPFNFFLIAVNLYLVFKGRATLRKEDTKILLYCSLPLILMVLVISIFRESYPHWSAPAYSCLLFLPAASMAGSSQKKPRIIPVVIKWALAYTLFIGLLEVFMINCFPGTTSLQKDGLKTGTKDYTLDMYGWKELEKQYDSVYRHDVATKMMSSTAPIIITHWSPGASIEFYLASKTKQSVIGIGDISDLHQYYWSNHDFKQLKTGDDAYYIVPSSDFYYRTFNMLKKNFRTYDQSVIIPQYRGGILCRYIYVYRMRGYLNHPQ